MPRPDTAGRTRPDRCPGVLSVHPAADGGLARIRLPGGRLRSSQLQTLMWAATELGDGRLELTSRANVQLRALRPGSEYELSDRLYDAGLLPSRSHERVRNIVASPRSGLDDHSRYDVMPLVAEVDRRLCESSALAELPGRFLFGLDDGRGDIARLAPDVAAQAVPSSAGTALRPGDTSGIAAFLLGGRDTGVRVPWTEVPALLIAAAEAFLAERRAQHSTAWRIAELDNGATAILTRLDSDRPDKPGPDAQTPAPADPERSSPSTGVGKLGILPYLPTPVSGGAQKTIGVWRRPDGATAAELGVQLGRLGPDQARLLAPAGAKALASPPAQRLGSTGAEHSGPATADQLALAGVELRVTPWRSAVVPALAGEAEEWLARFAAAGFVVDPGSAWVGVTACAGRPGCASALADVRADAERMVPELAAGRPVHWAGCERRCGRPRDSVDLVATGNGYVVDGTGSGGGAAGLAGAIDGARRVAR